MNVNHPESQEILISNWKAISSLVGNAISGAELAPCLPALTVAYLSVSLQQAVGPVGSWLALLWYSLNPLFCEQARLCIRAFRGKVLFFFLSGDPTVWVAISR